MIPQMLRMYLPSRWRECLMTSIYRLIPAGGKAAGVHLSWEQDGNGNNRDHGEDGAEEDCSHGQNFRTVTVAQTRVFTRATKLIAPVSSGTLLVQTRRRCSGLSDTAADRNARGPARTQSPVASLARTCALVMPAARAWPAEMTPAWPRSRTGFPPDL